MILSLGCYGCRDATDIKDDECIIEIPYEMDSIVSSVDFLTKKAMNTVNNKKEKGLCVLGCGPKVYEFDFNENKIISVAK